MSVYGLSSRMKPPALPIAEEVAAARRASGAILSCGKLPWVWLPEEARWVCRGACPEIALDAMHVQTVLVDGFAAHVAKCVGVETVEEPRLPQRRSRRTQTVATPVRPSAEVAPSTRCPSSRARRR